ncbi:uncharacterized protein LOC112126958 [Cimex lectularius]|uniref:Uncharacterized protein n=1 Tax=Cimex lectularius TaxID=79782 RepID=A0A8I6TK53_CIMLE|nr:uncharacterized protein LOC112126958 [Cimex lectularius]
MWFFYVLNFPQKIQFFVGVEVFCRYVDEYLEWLSPRRIIQNTPLFNTMLLSRRRQGSKRSRGDGIFRVNCLYVEIKDVEWVGGPFVFVSRLSEVPEPVSTLVISQGCVLLEHVFDRLPGFCQRQKLVETTG